MRLMTGWAIYARPWAAAGRIAGILGIHISEGITTKR
jgi:hypothetical protein